MLGMNEKASHATINWRLYVMSSTLRVNAPPCVWGGIYTPTLSTIGIFYMWRPTHLPTIPLLQIYYNL